MPSVKIPIGKDDSDSARRMARSEVVGSSLIGFSIQSLHQGFPRADYSMRDQKSNFSLSDFHRPSVKNPGGQA